MSKRRSRPRGRRGGPEPVDPQQVQRRSDGEWVVRRVTGSAATKSYRCPWCDQLIAPATPHVVAWPVEKSMFSTSALEERRHWHTACWNRRR